MNIGTNILIMVCFSISTSTFQNLLVCILSGWECGWRHITAPRICYLWILTIPRAPFCFKRILEFFSKFLVGVLVRVQVRVLVEVRFDIPGRSQFFKDLCFSKKLVLEAFAFFFLINVLLNFWINKNLVLSETLESMRWFLQNSLLCT